VAIPVEFQFLVTIEALTFASSSVNSYPSAPFSTGPYAYASVWALPKGMWEYPVYCGCCCGTFSLGVLTYLSTTSAEELLLALNSEKFISFP